MTTPSSDSANVNSCWIVVTDAQLSEAVNPLFASPTCILWFGLLLVYHKENSPFYNLLLGASKER